MWPCQQMDEAHDVWKNDQIKSEFENKETWKSK